MLEDVQIIRSRRKTLAIQVGEDGSVTVRAPLRAAKRDIAAFLEEHRDWIVKAQTRAAQRREVRAEAASHALSADELKNLAAQAVKVIPARAAFFAPKLGVSYGRITIRCQKTRWGSCSSKGNLNFNVLLMLAPPEVLDYVVVHELCHRLEMNHSSRFWALVATLDPDHKQHRRWLKENGQALLAMAGK